MRLGRWTIDVPEYFIARYFEEFREWAMNYNKILLDQLMKNPNQEGCEKTFILKEGYLADLSPDPEQGRILLGTVLVARVSRAGVEVRPKGEKDKKIISEHCAKMQRLRVHPRMFQKEPLRPGLPFMPTIGRPH